ncbi:anhydro-N-acetylmuramic acid kinase [Gaopeijia maritima]|uniref:anhydro-N-acetylmuramic acid kinase n=2 Tax=Gaopeijia maritima TaxID=3119007 RepID=UPI003251D3DF
MVPPPPTPDAAAERMPVDVGAASPLPYPGPGVAVRRVVGLMSGTSVDGIDAALLRIDGAGVRDLRWSLEAFESVPYAPERRARILAALSSGTPETLTRLHADLGEWFAEATLHLLGSAGVEPGAVSVVGSHGQTVWHRPPVDGRRGATLQLGDPATLAARTGIDVVSDFRSADVAAGGQGAPLVPWPDRMLFSVPEHGRVVLNVGGMANLTWLPPRGGEGRVVAFDTGPGNVLIDHAAALASGGTATFDDRGRGAAAGRVHPEVLDDLLRDPFFDRPPPRSTGREHFGPERVERLAERLGLGADDGSGWNDLLATLTEFTAVSIADAVARWLPGDVGDVLVAGGGAHNPVLVARLTAALAERGVGAPVRTGSDALGLDPDAREAAAFALLAWAHLERLPANLPEATGARGPRVLGSFTPAPVDGDAP